MLQSELQTFINVQSLSYSLAVFDILQSANLQVKY